VRRSRRLPLEELAPFLLDVPVSPASLDVQALFGNRQPLVAEIGFGKGLFLITAAQAAPELNFLGVEILRKYQLFTAARLAKRRLRNVRLVKADARDLLRDFVASGSVRALHVYFPDPWWKRRHAKRRLFTDMFVEQCERVLEPGGRLHLATDVADYFQFISNLISAHPCLMALPAPEIRQASHDLDYRTNFERKFRQQGRPVYQAIWERPASA
jgi:tRNA (guanine-N7-)-methyltransferase